MGEYSMGQRVRWVSSMTGKEHVGVVLAVGYGSRPPLLLRPDGFGNRWVAWEQQDAVLGGEGVRSE